MASPPLPHSLKPSVLDRLIDASREGSRAPTWYDLEGVVAAVERDLTDLLGTRQTHQGSVEGFPEVQQSLITYGFPDAASLLAITPLQRMQLARQLEQTVTLFEPRMKQVRVTVLDPADHTERMLRFRITGHLLIEPVVQLELDGSMEMTTGKITVTTAEK